MVARPQSQCGACLRYRSPMSLENVNGLAGPFCAAFPAGIPDRVWQNKVDHRRPVEGDQGIRWTSRDGSPFPTYAFDPAVLAGTADTLTAATDGEHSGAMIALVPSRHDLERYALFLGETPSAEEVDELHLTVVFLGDADLIDAETRATLLDWAGQISQSWDGIEGDAFAPAVFNPSGEEPCLVLIVGGPEVAEFHGDASADVADLMPLPDQHTPYIPHITLAYLDGTDTDGDLGMLDIGGMAPMTGPMIFDRLRVAFGGEVHDFPFGGEPAEPEAVEVEVPPVLAQTAAAQRDVFDGCLRCFGPAHSGECPPGL